MAGNYSAALAPLVSFDGKGNLQLREAAIYVTYFAITGLYKERPYGGLKESRCRKEITRPNLRMRAGACHQKRPSSGSLGRNVVFQTQKTQRGKCSRKEEKNNKYLLLNDRGALHALPNTTWIYKAGLF